MLPTASVLFCDEGRPSDFEKPRSARMWQPFVTNAPQGRGLPKWQATLYIAMERNSVHVRDFFRLPNDSVVLTKRSFCSPTDIVCEPGEDVDCMKKVAKRRVKRQTTRTNTTTSAIVGTGSLKPYDLSPLEQIRTELSSFLVDYSIKTGTRCHATLSL